MPLSPPAFYFPLDKGRYEIKPGLYKLTHDFGNDVVDGQIFQFDNQFNTYRTSKLAARHEQLEKYVCYANYPPDHDRLVSHHIIAQLLSDCPDCFTQTTAQSGLVLHCHLTAEQLRFSADGRYLPDRSRLADASVPYVTGLDALAMQVQEDLAVVELTPTGNRLIALHLCLPNHWAARDKIGQEFTSIHAPVPNMDKINALADALLQAVAQRGAYVRFAWGIATDQRLNHHPLPPPGLSRPDWQGRAFDRQQPQAWLRVERQTLSVIPASPLILFTIRTYHYDITELKQDATYRDCLCQAIVSMSADTLVYKGLLENKTDLLDWLRS